MTIKPFVKILEESKKIIFEDIKEQNVIIMDFITILLWEHHSMKIFKTCAYVKKVLNNGNSVHHIAKVV